MSFNEPTNATIFSCKSLAGHDNAPKISRGPALMKRQHHFASFANTPTSEMSGSINVGDLSLPR